MSRTRAFKGSVYHGGEKYTLEGVQNLRHSAMMGRLVVDKVNDLDLGQQTLPGMPEIHYTYTQSHPFALADQATSAHFTRKMDGTCVMFSPLAVGRDDMIVVCRTRGMLPVKDTKWRPLETLINRAVEGGLRERIEHACLTQKATLVFELYGNDNRHTVTYDVPIVLALHTVIKGQGSVQNWHTVKQIAKSNKIPIVETIEDIVGFDHRILLTRGDELVTEMERENDPEKGIYRQEGVVLNVVAGAKAQQWKFKPPSMTEFHRVARTNVCPITVAHTLWKMIDDNEDPELPALILAMNADYGEDSVFEQRQMIEREYWKWMTVQIDLGIITEL
jgi:hypothetical protein